MTVEEKAYNYASKLAKNRITASEVAAHYGRGYIEGQEDMKQLGWHPASELPNESGIYVVVTDFYSCQTAIFAKYDKDKGWDTTDIDNIEWWCYPPEEE